MELIRGLHTIQPRHQGCVLTIGNFDGVHLGHQAVLTQLKAIAAELNLPAVVMVFEPQPLELFNPEGAPARLCRFREKYHWLAQQGVDRMLCVPFTREFASQEPEQFIQDLLLNKLGVAPSSYQQGAHGGNHDRDVVNQLLDGVNLRGVVLAGRVRHGVSFH